MDLYEFSIFDILPYFYLLFFLLYLTFKKKIINADRIAFFMLFFFSAVRYGIGYDYFNYCDAIKTGYTFEPLSEVIASLARTFDCYQIFFIINSFITIFCIYLVARRESFNSCLVLLIYYLYPIFFLESLSIVRNASALSLVFLSYHYLSNKKYCKYLICIFLAGMMHYSGFIGLLLLVVKFLPLGRKKSILLFCLCFLISDSLLLLLQQLEYGGDSVFLLKLLKYADRMQEQGKLMKYIILLFNVFNLLYWNKLVSYNLNNKVLLNLVNIGTCLWVVLSFDHTLSLRLSSYYLIFQLLLIPSYFEIANYKYRKIVRFGIISFFVIFFLSGFVINIINYEPTSKMSYIPYQTIFYHQDYANYQSHF